MLERSTDDFWRMTMIRAYLMAIAASLTTSTVIAMTLGVMGGVNYNASAVALLA